MFKVAFIGMERTGKTTIIREVASKLSKNGISSFIFQEIINHAHNLNVDLENPDIQTSLALEQISQELIYSNNNYRDVLLVDRTPLEILMYKEFIYLEKDLYKPIVHIKFKEFIFEWMKTYDIVYRVVNTELKPIVNTHFTQKDLESQESRQKILDNYIKYSVNRDIVTVFTDKKIDSITDLIVEEIKEIVNGNKN